MHYCHKCVQLHYARFHYSICAARLLCGCCQYRPMSTLYLKKDGDDSTFSGNEFPLSITILLKQCYRVAFLHLGVSTFRL